MRRPSVTTHGTRCMPANDGGFETSAEEPVDGPARVVDLGRKAKTMVRERCDRDRITDRYEALCDGVLGCSSPKPRPHNGKGPLKP